MKNVFLVILAGVCWGVVSIFVTKLQAAGFSSMQCVALRMFFAMLVLLVYLLITDRSKLKIHIADLPYFIVMGFVSMAFTNLCYFKCLEAIGSSSIPTLLLYTAPIFVVIISAVIYKEKITRQKFFALILTFLGLVTVTGVLGGGDKIPVYAFIFGIGAALGHSSYSIVGKFVTGKYAAVTVTFYMFLWASVIAVPVSGITANLSLLLDAKIILVVVCMVLISTVTPYFAYLAGLSGMEAGKAAVLSYAEPATAALAGVLYFKEVLTANKAIGMLLILAAIVCLNVKLPARKARQTC